MREQMTLALRSALDHAQTAARELNQDFVGTEHLMLGLLHTPGGEIQEVLSSVGTSSEALTKALAGQLPQSPDEPVVVGQLPLSPKAQHAIHFALAQAQTVHLAKVSTRLLLLALIQDAQPGVIQTVIDSAGVKLATLKASLRTEPARPEL